MALRDDVSLHALVCIRSYVLAKEFRFNLPKITQAELIDLVKLQLRGEFEVLLREVGDYLTNNPVE